MTVSGTTSYNATTLDIIEEAYALVRVGVDEEPLTDVQAQNAKRTLNMMFKAWMADGLHLWTKTEGVLFLVNGQAKYGLGGTTSDHSALADDTVTTSLTADAVATATTITVDDASSIASGDNIGVLLNSGALQWTTVSGAPSGSTVTLAAALTGDADTGAAVFTYTTALVRPTRILQARRRLFTPNQSNITDIPITIMERPDYFDQPTKLQAGTETMLYYDPQLVTGYIYLWQPASVCSDTVRFTFERPLDDFDTLTETADIPQQWIETLAWNLAARLAFKTSFPMNERAGLIQIAEAMKQKMLAFDRENGSVFFSPDYTWGGGFDGNYG